MRIFIVLLLLRFSLASDDFVWNTIPYNTSHTSNEIIIDNCCMGEPCSGGYDCYSVIYNIYNTLNDE